MDDKERRQYERRVTGAQSRMAGQIFEQRIEESISYYEERGFMRARKTPEPMKPIKPMGKQGQFLACYTKAAQVDFSGTLDGGQAVRFEAKQTDTTRFNRDRLTEEQMVDLEEHQKLGAFCFVILCFGFNNFYRVPWDTWRDMKAIYGRQYVTEKDIEQYRLHEKNGIILILDGLMYDEEAMRWTFQ